MTAAALSDIASGRRIRMAAAQKILDRVLPGSSRFVQVVRADGRFAIAARNVEYVGRLAQAGITSAQRTHQVLALPDGGAEMRGAGRKIAMMEVIGLDAAFHEGAHQVARSEERRVGKECRCRVTPDARRE